MTYKPDIAIRDKGGQVYNVLTNGADPTGVTDCTSVVNGYITQANAAGGGTVFFPPGTYLALNIALLSNVRLVGYGATINKNGGNASTYVVTMNGTASGTSTLLTADVTVLSTSVTVTSATGFAVGDYCLLYDSTNKTGSSVSRNQEIVRIQSIVGTTVTIYGNTYGSYATASAATLQLITPVANAGIEGVTLANTGSGGLVEGLYVWDSVLRDVKAVGPNEGPAYWIKQSQHVRLFGCEVRDAINTVSPNGYGILFDQSSIGCIAYDCYTENIRENFISNNGRACGFIGCQGFYHADTGFNTHGSGNSNCFFLGNTAVGAVNGGIAVGFGTDSAADTDIAVIGNTVVNSQAHGIQIVSNDNGLHRHLRITVSHNIVTGFSLVTTGFSGIFASTVDSLNVIDNQVEAGAGVSAHACINLRFQHYCQCSANKISNSSFAFGISYFQCSYSTIEDNGMNGTGSGPLHYDGGTCINLLVQNNRMDRPKSDCTFSGTEVLLNNTYSITTSIDTGVTQSLTYGTTVTPTPHQAPYMTITVTNGTAFTIANADTTAGPGPFSLVIKNSSGGAMGTITWGANYVFTNGAWTNPANTKSRNITFFYDGTNFVEQSRSTVDY